MTLGVAILMHMNEVAVGDAINAHLHDRFVAHADLYTAIATSAMAVLTTLMLAFTSEFRLPHAILVIVVVGLAPRTLRA